MWALVGFRFHSGISPLPPPALLDRIQRATEKTK
jgi:hypothetical protein